MSGTDNVYYGPKEGVKLRNYLRMLQNSQKHPNF